MSHLSFSSRLSVWVMETETVERKREIVEREREKEVESSIFVSLNVLGED